MDSISNQTIGSSIWDHSYGIMSAQSRRMPSKSTCWLWYIRSGIESDLWLAACPGDLGRNRKTQCGYYEIIGQLFCIIMAVCAAHHQVRNLASTLRPIVEGSCDHEELLACHGEALCTQPLHVVPGESSLYPVRLRQPTHFKQQVGTAVWRKDHHVMCQGAIVQMRRTCTGELNGVTHSLSTPLILSPAARCRSCLCSSKR